MVNFGVMIGIHTNFFSTQMKSKTTMFHGLEFVVRLEVGKSPQSAIDDVRKAFLLRYLKCNCP